MSRPAQAETANTSEGGKRDFIIFQDFEGMNTQSMRQGLPEKKLAWCENLQPIAPNNLKTVPSSASPLHTISGKTIVKQYYFNYGKSTDYIISITSDGAGYQTVNPGGTTTKFANASTFSIDPDFTQWGTSLLLIADPTAGYCVLSNGTVFVEYGGVSPNITVSAGGSGYTNGATAAISGGSGSGATASVTVVGGVVTAVVLTNAGTGYKSGDTLTVTITAVSGGSSATATCHPWPLVTPYPTTLAVFQGRVFMSSMNVITYTGTGGYDDFSSGNASGTFTINDPDLVRNITALRSLDNYLFVIGDASIKQIGNLTVSSSVTSFTLVTLSSDQGTIYRDTVVSYDRLLVFANTVGVYAVFGSSVQKISDDMDGIFQLTDFSQEPISAINDINNIHCFLLLVRYKDPTQGTRSIILSYMNKKWFVISQGDSLTSIITANVGGAWETFSTSGSDITQLLENPNGNVSILVKTPLSPHGNPVQKKNSIRFAIAQNVTQFNNLTFLIESESGGETTTFFTEYPVTWVNNSDQPIQWQNNSQSNVNFTGPGFSYLPGQATASGIYLGATLSGTVANYALNMIAIEYETGQLFQSGGPL